MHDAIDRLAALFQKFPGIGPRQAGRFVHYLLRSSPSLRRELANAIRDLAEVAHQCPECYRFHSGERATCAACESPERDASLLAVVASDADVIALEQSGTFNGRCFVLGGTILLGAEKNPHLRTKELLASLPKRLETGLREVILAFPANPEGDATAASVREHLNGIVGNSLRTTTLGRGLSTGSELEYADPDTIRNALDNRK